MPTVNISREIHAPLDKVWDVISDVDNEPQYWHGTKSIRNISKNGNVIQREVVIAFKDSKTMQTVTLNPKTSVDTRVTEGPITGSRVVTLSVAGSGTKVDVIWEFKLAGLLSVFGGMVKKHIGEGTEQALERIAKAVE
ncbi:type II toxin-antitoxin system RatA family toxin [Candidatus Nitrososphaera sp. FF02]|uniref:type II toxin-antitoxin system RatA family toxin n=1 Tax=Candidatus Nitrososphaera sp. FF02 TaxID=3398226 RepID=UPI0039EC117A